MHYDPEMNDELNEYDYELCGMKKSLSDPRVVLLVRCTGHDQESEYKVLVFVAKDADLLVLELLRKDGQASCPENFDSPLPDDAPREVLIFREVLEFVKSVMVPQEGEIGEAEIRYVMNKHQCDRQAAIQTIKYTREKIADEREYPDFEALSLMAMLARHKGCTWSMENDKDGNWTFRINSPLPGQRMVSENGLFSQVLMDVIHHLNKIPCPDKEQP